MRVNLAMKPLISSGWQYLRQGKLSPDIFIVWRYSVKMARISLPNMLEIRFCLLGSGTLSQYFLNYLAFNLSSFSGSDSSWAGDLGFGMGCTHSRKYWTQRFFLMTSTNQRPRVLVMEQSCSTGL
jgi:hypothetical protein